MKPKNRQWGDYAEKAALPGAKLLKKFEQNFC